MAQTSPARLMDGRDLARRIVDTSSTIATDLRRRTGTAPCLATVLVGDDPASATYVRMKRNRCEQAGIRSRHVALPGFVSCTPGGILRLLDEYRVDLAGRHAVVVGRSPILGRPAGLLLLGRDATVTYCHSRTADLSAITREADVLVAAVGRPRLITGADIKPGAVVVDAGYHPGNVGDVDFASARERASLITPVPGGVGPMPSRSCWPRRWRRRHANSASAEPESRNGNDRQTIAMSTNRDR
ncbi:bifunctional 5,10-methylenetetrahydrofolate dehydrogenase/5,10-methenyltetrahydrofolate cyclohydrolase [Micromonospora echinospora]|uniref:bifunctional 5,10-methylenetetrahydrofolate dehydrogenase/5,10-methenyltetrahydrofolate cyclohydrolase n=1 Tax=Micromonospora echinospora TaxID=1877 RepID=UPI00366D6C4E